MCVCMYLFIYVCICVTLPGQTKNDTDLQFGTHTPLDSKDYIILENRAIEEICGNLRDAEVFRHYRPLGSVLRKNKHVLDNHGECLNQISRSIVWSEGARHKHKTRCEQT